MTRIDQLMKRCLACNGTGLKDGKTTNVVCGICNGARVVVRA